MNDADTDDTPAYLTIADAARELGITPRRVRQLCVKGRLKARKLGRDWLILPHDLDAARDRPTGRPPWHDQWVKDNPERAIEYAAECKERERRRAKRLREEAREAKKQQKAKRGRKKGQETCG
jgi:excisionase family DNA binding protein